MFPARSALWPAAVVALLGCGGGGPAAPAGPTPLDGGGPPSRVDIDVVSDGVIRVGSRFRLVAYRVDAAGRRVEVDAAWRSLTEELVSVRPGGVAGALAVGDAVVEATYRHPGVAQPYVSEAGLRVAPADVSAVALRVDGWPGSLPVGKTVRLTASVRWSDGVVEPVEAEWSVSNAVVAEITGGGLVHALAAGAFDVSAGAYGLVETLPGLLVVAGPEPPVPNRVPTVTLDCDPCVTEPRSQLRLRAVALDPDGDSLSFEWTAETGILSVSTRAEVVWTAPGYEGAFPVSVTVTDSAGAGVTVRRRLLSEYALRTEPGADHPPVSVYADCPTLLASGWDQGVSRGGGTYRGAWDEAEMATYRWNQRLDFDSDGSACAAEPARVVLAVRDDVIAEGCLGLVSCLRATVVTATLSRPVAAPVAVRIDLETDLLPFEHSDEVVYDQDGSLIRFGGGEVESADRVIIEAVDNRTFRPEFRVVEVTGTVTRGPVAPPVPAYVTIRDDEPPPEIQLTVTPPVLIEDSATDSTAEVVPVMTLPCAEELLLAVEVEAGRRTTDADFAVDGRRLTFPLLSRSPVGLVRIRAIPDSSNDDDSAPSEEIIISVARLSGCPAVLPDPRVVTIVVN